MKRPYEYNANTQPSKRGKTREVIDLVDIPDDDNPSLTMTYWAKNLYRDPKLPYIGKINLEKLFMKRKWTAKSCGKSGYRLFGEGEKQIQLRGADNNLARIAWPADNSSSKKRNKTNNVELDDGRVYFGPDGGRKRGEDVHKEIEDFANLTPDQFVAAHPQVDPLTKAVLDVIKELKLRAIAGEFKVYDLISESGTGIDIVCMDVTGDIVLIELKTGYPGSNFVEVYENTLSMLSPFSNIKDTPLNRARMQLLYGSILLEQSHGVRAANHLVIHATPDTNTAVVHTLSQIVEEHRQTLLSAIRYERSVDATIKQSRAEFKKQNAKQRIGTKSSSNKIKAKKNLEHSSTVFETKPFSGYVPIGNLGMKW